MWEIIFSYNDGSEIKISKNDKALPLDLAIKYRNLYSRSSNDGGIVYTYPLKYNNPVPLNEYIGF